MGKVFFFVVLGEKEEKLSGVVELFSSANNSESPCFCSPSILKVLGLITGHTY
jgi:hypothetical protein